MLPQRYWHEIFNHQLHYEPDNYRVTYGGQKKAQPRLKMYGDDKNKVTWWLHKQVTHGLLLSFFPQHVCILDFIWLLCKESKTNHFKWSSINMKTKKNLNKPLFKKITFVCIWQKYYRVPFSKMELFSSSQSSHQINHKDVLSLTHIIYQRGSACGLHKRPLQNLLSVWVITFSFHSSVLFHFWHHLHFYPPFTVPNVLMLINDGCACILYFSPPIRMKLSVKSEGQLYLNERQEFRALP